jgi:hypothetical protein
MTTMFQLCLVDSYGLNEQKQSDKVLGFNPTRDWVAMMNSPNPSGNENHSGIAFIENEQDLRLLLFQT